MNADSSIEKIDESTDSGTYDPANIVPAEVMEKLPEDVQQQISLIVSQQRFGAAPSPFATKITEGHIDKLIDASTKDSEREHQDRNRDRWVRLVCFLVTMGVFVFLVYYMVGKDTELLRTLIHYLMAFAGGFGVKAYLDRGR
jgi:hypothetical protein